MATPTAAEVRTISLSSEFNATPDATIHQAVVEAGRQYTGLVSEPEHTEIVALHACHLLRLMGAGTGGVGGPVASATAGAVSVSFAVAAVAPSAGVDFRTPYGERCLALLAGLGPAIRAGGNMPWTP